MDASEWFGCYAALGGEGGAVFKGDVEEEDLHDEHDYGLDEKGDIIFCAGEVENAGGVLEEVHKWIVEKIAMKVGSK